MEEIKMEEIKMEEIIMEEMKMEVSIPPELIKIEIKKEEDDFLIKSETYSTPASQIQESSSRNRLHYEYAIAGDTVQGQTSPQNSADAETETETKWMKLISSGHDSSYSDYKQSSFPSDKQKLFQCSLCFYKTKRKSQLFSHQLTHTGEKLYKCSECSYSTSKNSSLVRHHRTHTGEKPYKCSECSFSTSRKSCLTRHQRTHTGEKPYKCFACSFSTSRKSSLNSHQRTHTGEKAHKCSECSYSSSQKSCLIRHQRTHTGEKPYKCSQCSYRASQKSNILSHQLIHTSEKPLKCSECSFSTSRKPHLIRHQLTHRGDKLHKYNESNTIAIINHGRKEASTIPSQSSDCLNNACYDSTCVPCLRSGFEEDSPTFHDSSQAPNSFQNDSIEGPIFVKPIPFVTFADSIVSIPSSFSSYQPASHMSHLVAPLTFSPGEFVFTPPPTVSPTYSTTYPPPSHILPPLSSPVSTVVMSVDN